MKSLWLGAAVAATIFATGSVYAAGLLPAKTTTIIFNAAAMKAASSISGYCWTGSIASRRADAYRCMAGNVIHDPCFSLDAKSVACPTDALQNSGVRMTITKPLPEGNIGGGRNAWLMQLAGGATCNIGTGTIVSGYPFYCSGNLVCASPPADPSQPAVFVACGRPKSAAAVSDIGHYLVTRMYE